MAESCFVRRLCHYLDLSAAEKEIVTALERDSRTLSPGQTLWKEGEDVDAMCIVQDGWLLSQTKLEDEGRQILRFYFSGDMVGTAGVAFTKAASTVTAVKKATICVFPRAALRDIFERHPRLAALFYALGMLENVTLGDRLRALGRTDGKARLAHLFLSIAERLRILHGKNYTTLQVPLTQADLADAVGLTAIHVNRLIREMTETGLITRNRREVTLLDEKRLREISQYIDRHHQIDIGWFPPEDE